MTEGRIEPTLYDVIDGIAVLSGHMEERFDRIETVQAVLVEGVDNLRERMGVVEQGLVKLTNRVEDIADKLEEVADMASGNTDKISDHESRILRLEKVAA